MRTVRPSSEGWDTKYPSRKDADGHFLCRWCAKVLTGKKTSWCSRECTLEVLSRTVWKYARIEVLARDEDICQLCGVDTERQWNVARAAGREGQRFLFELWEINSSSRHFCEVDHIVPVIEGGALCDWENLRTLCLVCHHRVTAELKARLAKEKRRQKKFAQEPLWREEAAPVPDPPRTLPAKPAAPYEPEPF